MRRRRRRAGVFEQRRVVDGGPPRRVLRAMRLRGASARRARRSATPRRRASSISSSSSSSSSSLSRGRARGRARRTPRRRARAFARGGRGARENDDETSSSPRAHSPSRAATTAAGSVSIAPRRSVEHGRGRDDVRERDREPDAPQFPRARHPRPRVGAADGAVETSVTRDVSPRGDARVEGVGGHRVRGAVAERRRRGGDVRVGGRTSRARRRRRRREARA